MVNVGCKDRWPPFHVDKSYLHVDDIAFALQSMPLYKPRSLEKRYRALTEAQVVRHVRPVKPAIYPTSIPNPLIHFCTKVLRHN